MIGLTEDTAALRRYQTVGTELSKIIGELEQSAIAGDSQRHEQYTKFQTSFHSDVKGLLESADDLSNQFLEDNGQHSTLYSSIMMQDITVQSAKYVFQIGATRYDFFMEWRVSHWVSWNCNIKRNKLLLLSDDPKHSKIKLMLLFPRKREQNHPHATGFTHENSSSSPSPSRSGEMHRGTRHFTVCYSCITYNPGWLINPTKVDVVWDTYK